MSLVEQLTLLYQKHYMTDSDIPPDLRNFAEKFTKDYEFLGAYPEQSCSRQIASLVFNLWRSCAILF